MLFSAILCLKQNFKKNRIPVQKQACLNLHDIGFLGRGGRGARFVAAEPLLGGAEEGAVDALAGGELVAEGAQHALSPRDEAAHDEFVDEDPQPVMIAERQARPVLRTAARLAHRYL